ncbi:transposase [Ileibacterium valens]|uniref:transposase n=1 Tax=Ileibacterium valens TaxID=1862668 RepID=UPI00259BC611|nr:transposase [Ileibacterium valens]
MILTDRGAEFTMAREIEDLGCRIFYCDPMASSQKPHVENNHLLFRRICPKKINLKKQGLDSQAKVDLIFSHINSYPREEKFGKSPIEILKFFHQKSDLLERLHMKEIGLDKLQLNPGLLRSLIEESEF